ncbi:MAG: MBOAT family protein [Bacteroidota bacterium]|nr:MBOAT family protein [Bacteroidota bacterium]
MPHRFRWMLLFVASCFFYMVFYPPYILILFAVVLIDYVCGLLIEKNTGYRRKLFLITSIVGNIGLLSYFKYYNFFIESWTDIAAYFHHTASFEVHDILLPIGLSFHTFQSLSYTIEVYKGNQKAERHIGYFANYVLFFPQMVAGPIERYERLGRQLRENHPYLYENISKGFRLVLYGLFVKMCVADNLAPIVNDVYDHPENFNQGSIFIALVAFSLQIYADFYGYSTIAIGAAKMMGIDLMNNFRQPYFAPNIREFWKRWHISLTSWFRDYVFIPLGGSRVNTFRLILNILIVFSLSGFWHGANYTFIIWGALHGGVYLLELFANKIPFIARLSSNGVFRIFSGIRTFLIVTFIWIFFRAKDLANAKAVIYSLFHSSADALQEIKLNVWSLIPMLIFIFVEVIIINKRIDSRLENRPVYVRWTFYFSAMMCILLFSGIKSYPFIYFRF